MVTQSIAWEVADATTSALESGVAVWAVFNALDTVPAAADDQRAYLEARAVVEEHLGRLGLPAERLRAAMKDARLPQADRRARGDPRLDA